MNLSGIKGLASMAVIVLLVSGCSSQRGPEYDPLEVIEYETCLNAYMQASELSRYTLYKHADITESAIEECERFKPTKQG